MTRFVKEVGRNFNQELPQSGPGSGSVTSVALTAPTGFVVSGSPITSSGTLAITFASGYSLPTTTKQGQWDSAYAFTSTFPSGTAQQLLRVNTLGTALEFFTPSFLVSTDIIASSPLVWNSGTKTMSIPAATSSVNGYLTSSDWLTFSSKQPAITLTTTGNSGSATLIGATLNIPTYTLAGLGGMANPMTSLGDMIYGNAVGIPLRVPPNTTTTKKYLSMTGDGSVGAQPVWDTIPASIGGSGTTNYIPKFTASGTIGNSVIYESSGSIGINTTTPSSIFTISKAASNFIFDLENASEPSFKIRAYNHGTASAPGLAFTYGLYYNTTENTAIRFYRGGSATGGFLTFTTNDGTEKVRIDVDGDVGINQNNPTEKLDVVGNIKLSGYVTGGSWQGNAVYPAYGGTGATSLTGVVIGNGTSSMTAVAGTSGQLLRRNVANTDYEFFTPNFVSNPMTSFGDMIYSNASGAALRLAANTTTTKRYLVSVGDGTNGAAPYWDTITGFTGTGTTNYITKFTSSSAIGNSLLYDSGVGVSIGNTSPQKLVHIAAANGGTVLRMENTDTTVSIGETIGAIEFYGNDTASGVGGIIDANGGGLSGEVNIDIWAGTNGNIVGGITAKYTGAINFTPYTSDPSPAAAGDVYYNSSTNKLRCYNGTSWNDLF